MYCAGSSSAGDTSLQTHLSPLHSLLEEKDRELHSLHSQYQQLLNEHDLLQITMKKQAIDHHTEKKQLEKRFTTLLQQLQNSTNTSSGDKVNNSLIDKELMKNLILQYVQRKRSKEILELISKVLQLNDEELVMIGLRVPNNLASYLPLNGLFSNLIRNVVGMNGQEPSPPIEVSSLVNMMHLFVLI